MHWNEKIDLIKKKYSHEDFSVPHADRKEVLRKIETKFIGRSAAYYELNNSNDRFSNWWTDIKDAIDITVESDKVKPLVESVFNADVSFWMACEFDDGVLIYKSKLEPAFDLISIGQTRTTTFHLIHMKYDFLVSTRFTESKINVKVAGANEFMESTKRVVGEGARPDGADG